MASRENSKAYSQAASGLTTIDEDLQRRVLESLPWDEAPFSSLKSADQDLLQNRAQVSRYGLGEKIWSQDIRGSQYFIVTGKVRLREEETSKPIATLEPGDWFGELLLFSVDCKAIAASKEVIVVAWDVDVWTQVSTSEVAAFWEGSTENEPVDTNGLKNQGLSELANVLGAMSLTVQTFLPPRPYLRKNPNFKKNSSQLPLLKPPLAIHLWLVGIPELHV
jgi:ATP-binding cassette, subfamily B, bacterial